jgi:hypothetical protein
MAILRVSGRLRTDAHKVSIDHIDSRDRDPSRAAAVYDERILLARDLHLAVDGIDYVPGKRATGG